MESPLACILIFYIIFLGEDFANLKHGDMVFKLSNSIIKIVKSLFIYLFFLLYLNKLECESTIRACKFCNDTKNLRYWNVSKCENEITS